MMFLKVCGIPVMVFAVILQSNDSHSYRVTDQTDDGNAANISPSPMASMLQETQTTHDKIVDLPTLASEKPYNNTGGVGRHQYIGLQNAATLLGTATSLNITNQTTTQPDSITIPLRNITAPLLVQETVEAEKAQQTSNSSQTDVKHGDDKFKNFAEVFIIWAILLFVASKLFCFCICTSPEQRAARKMGASERSERENKDGYELNIFSQMMGGQDEIQEDAVPIIPPENPPSPKRSFDEPLVIVHAAQ